MKKLLVIQVAGLGWDFLKKQNSNLSIPWQKMQTITPAVTCSVQASFKTAKKPNEHGIVANGFYFSQMHKPLFWEQNSELISGEMIWQNWREKKLKVGVGFWQQSLGNNVDFLLSPAPIHKHHGSMILDCYDLPRGLYANLKEKLGEFPLMNYWGPLASGKSTDWITNSTIEILQNNAPDLYFVYLPHLDYELQKSGPNSYKSTKAYSELEKNLQKLLQCAYMHNYETIIFGDYAIMEVDNPIFPNKILRKNGLMNFRKIKKMLYPDFYNSVALTIVDHQVAHVKVFDKSKKAEIREIFEKTKGVAQVIDGEEIGEFGAGNVNSGELILVAQEKSWFSYHWWEKSSEAPDYASHIDIHNKIGFEPCELFWKIPLLSISTNCKKIKGSHGLAGEKFPVAWCATFELKKTINTILDLSEIVRDWFEESGKY